MRNFVISVFVLAAAVGTIYFIHPTPAFVIVTPPVASLSPSGLAIVAGSQPDLKIQAEVLENGVATNNFALTASESVQTATPRVLPLASSQVTTTSGPNGPQLAATVVPPVGQNGFSYFDYVTVNWTGRYSYAQIPFFSFKKTVPVAFLRIGLLIRTPSGTVQSRGTANIDVLLDRTVDAPITVALQSPVFTLSAQPIVVPPNTKSVAFTATAPLVVCPKNIEGTIGNGPSIFGSASIATAKGDVKIMSIEQSFPITCEEQ